MYKGKQSYFRVCLRMLQLQLIQYLKEAGISAIELMGDAVEDYAGRPANPVPMRWTPGQPRPTLTDEQKAAMAKYQKDVSAWNFS